MEVNEEARGYHQNGRPASLNFICLYDKIPKLRISHVIEVSKTASVRLWKWMVQMMKHVHIMNISRLTNVNFIRLRIKHVKK